MIILLKFFELNKNRINEVDPDRWQKSESEYLECNCSSNFLYENNISEYSFDVNLLYINFI